VNQNLKAIQEEGGQNPGLDRSLDGEP